MLYYYPRRCTTLNERLKLLRSTLGINQSDFSNKIGVSRSAISRLESGDINFTEQMILSICREFNVNRAWFVEGTGDMFSNLPKTILDELALHFELTDDEKELVSDFCNLPKDYRKIIINYFRGKK